MYGSPPPPGRKGYLCKKGRLKEVYSMPIIVNNINQEHHCHLGCTCNTINPVGAFTNSLCLIFFYWFALFFVVLFLLLAL